MLTMKAQIKVLVADSHYFDEEQDPDPHLTRIKVKSWIRIWICIKVMRN
jgi:hypothetical protein